MKSKVRLDLFDSTRGYSRGRSAWYFAVWLVVKHFFFLTSLPWPVSFKVWLLRLFGAEVGKGAILKPRINIHLPWKLKIGDHCWIGEEVCILNFEPVVLGSHVCVSQRAFLCAGNHDFREPSLPFRNAPITIGDGVWVGSNCFVAPNVSIGVDTVITACSVVTRNMPEGMVCSGNPCVPLKPRWN